MKEDATNILANYGRKLNNHELDRVLSEALNLLFALMNYRKPYKKNESGGL
jgi:predicted metal-dependent hydrolase